MFRMIRADKYDLWFSQVVRPFTFSAPFAGEDFALLLVVADPTITAVERAAISEEIVRQGCRYAVCAGHECFSWDDSIDLAYLATSPDFSPSDERFVMTTWHEDQSLEDVADYFWRNTVFDGFVPGHYLVLLLGGDAGTAEQVRLALKKSFGVIDGPPLS